MAKRGWKKSVASPGVSANDIRLYKWVINHGVDTWNYNVADRRFIDNLLSHLQHYKMISLSECSERLIFHSRRFTLLQPARAFSRL